ncbi:hypothetical protein M885DRAFT_513238 [Pelagophyceae sp. CCMP2097]|nr:hypothetical protein M885DRAFT_513238 [Pelagophyceae sp. CCMP2097]|mmetsp:Transcript_27931/g.94020  ORF Transcript_27931/g.94020 Transcript_27931/m.94020 type:complete len:409 (+) Transcript_27931:77-1303(+)
MYEGRLRSRSSVLRSLTPNDDNTPCDRRSRKRRERPQKPSDDDSACRDEDWIEGVLKDAVHEDLAWLSDAVDQSSVLVGQDWPRERRDRVDSLCSKLGLERRGDEYEIRRASFQETATLDAIKSCLVKNGWLALDSPPRPLSLPRTTSPIFNPSPPPPPVLARCDSLVDRMTQLHVWRSATTTLTTKSASTPARTSSIDSDIKHAMRFEEDGDDDDDFSFRARSFDSSILHTAPRCTNALKLSFDSAATATATTSRKGLGARASLEAAVARFSFGGSSRQSSSSAAPPAYDHRSDARESTDSCAAADRYADRSAQRPRRSARPAKHAVGKPRTTFFCAVGDVINADSPHRTRAASETVTEHRTPNHLAGDGPRRGGWGAHPEFGDWATTEAADANTLSALRDAFQHAR